MHLLDAAAIACDVCDVFEHHESVGNILIRHSKVVFILNAEQNDCFIILTLFV